MSRATKDKTMNSFRCFASHPQRIPKWWVKEEPEQRLTALLESLAADVMSLKRVMSLKLERYS